MRFVKNVYVDLHQHFMNQIFVYGFQ